MAHVYDIDAVVLRKISDKVNASLIEDVDNDSSEDEGDVQARAQASTSKKCRENTRFNTKRRRTTAPER